MLGYDISWAAFNIIEVMSSSKFTYKVRKTGMTGYLRMYVCLYVCVSFVCSLSVHLYLSCSQRIGYLAASQCFHDGLDVVMLTTNMIKKVCTCMCVCLGHGGREGGRKRGEYDSSVHMQVCIYINMYANMPPSLSPSLPPRTCLVATSMMLGWL